MTLPCVNKKTLLVWALLCGLAFLCYRNVIGATFLWDDEVIVVSNGIIRSFAQIPHIFSAGVFGGATDFSGFFRPLQTFSYMIDYHFWKLDPTGYHITNIVLHAVNAILVFGFVSIFSSRLTAVFAAVLFVIHPVNTETVAYVSDRGDLLCFMFGMLGMNLFVRTTRVMPLALSALCVLAATLSKEHGIVFPFLMVAYAAIFSRDEKRLTWALVLSLAACCYGGIMFVKTIQATQQTLSAIATAPYVDRIATIPQIVYGYLRLSVLPHSLHMEYHGVTKFLSADMFWYLAAALIMLAVLWFAAPRKKEALFWLLWAAIALGPFLQILKPLPATMREHWLYLPLVGLVALYAEIVLRYYEDTNTRRATAVIAGVTMLVFVLFSYARNNDWRNAAKLYAHDVKFEQGSFLLWNNIGVEAFRRGSLQEAADSFAKAIGAGPGNRYGMAYNNLGYVYQLAKKNKEAEGMYVQSLRLSPNERAFLNLGGLYIEAGRFADAEQVLSLGAGAFPSNTELSKSLAQLRAYRAKAGIK